MVYLEPFNAHFYLKKMNLESYGNRRKNFLLTSQLNG